jgi:putative hemolysin
MESDERKQIKGNNKIKKVFLAPAAGLHNLLGKVIGAGEKVTENDILSMVDAAEESGVIEGTGVEIITNALEFDDLAVSDVMTHRVNVVGFEADTSLDDIIYTALEKGFSRLPVYRENLDNIIGIIIVKDLLSLVGKSDTSDFSLESFIRKVEFIPESCHCTNVFKKMKDEKISMAVVVDEYGGTAGIVTMEDLIEEVMGNIQDEYDDEDTEIEQLNDKDNVEKYKIDGETDPEEVLELFGHTLPENHEYETIAGFVVDKLGFIPDEGTKPHVDYKDVRFVVTQMEDSSISQIVAYRRVDIKTKNEKNSKEKERR